MALCHREVGELGISAAAPFLPPARLRREAAGFRPAGKLQTSGAAATMVEPLTNQGTTWIKPVPWKAMPAVVSPVRVASVLLDVSCKS